MPFEQQIAHLSAERLRQMRTTLENQRRSHFQRWMTSYSPGQARIGTPQMRDVDRRIAAIDARLTGLESHESNGPQPIDTADSLIQPAAQQSSDGESEGAHD